MAHPAAGAEACARFKQWEYRASSSLVLTTDSRFGDTRQPTGEPESLWGKIDPKSFGDRAYRAKPPELEEKLNMLKKKKDRDPAFDATTQPTSKKRRLHEETVLTSSDEGLYRPKGKVSRAAYEAMLNVIQQQLGHVTGAGDEILAVLKSDRVNKKKEIEELLKLLPNHTFDQLVSYCSLITDYSDAGDDDLRDDAGVAVGFEDNEEDEEESDLDMIPEDEEEEDDVAVVAGAGAMQMGGGIHDVERQEANEGPNLNVQDIDA